MSKMILYVGNKNLSSWSLRPWLMMKQMGLEFDEQVIRLDNLETRTNIHKISPSGKVPALVHEGQTIWDSLAICEYLHDLYPQKSLWPEDIRVRAVARCVSHEMHSGFSAMRAFWPMNFNRNAMSHQFPPDVRRDVKRITEIWSMCRQRFSQDGPFLFGSFTIADAMYAPVVSRLRTYGPLDLSEDVIEYCQNVWTLPAMREWGEGAARELISEDL